MTHDSEQSQSNLRATHVDLGLCDAWGGVVLSGLEGRVRKKGNFRKELKETRTEGKGSLGKEGLVPWKSGPQLFGTRDMEDNFSWTAGRGWFQDDSNTLHFLGTLGASLVAQW